MSTFERKPTAPIEARQWDGSVESYDTIEAWAGVGRVLMRGRDDLKGFAMAVMTPTGQSMVPVGGWIVKRSDRDFYAMDDETFSELYNEVKDATPEAPVGVMEAAQGEAFADHDQELHDRAAIARNLQEAAAPTGGDPLMKGPVTGLAQLIGSMTEEAKASIDDLLERAVSNRPASGRHFSFSEALQHMKEGHRVARQGWNGKGMWICLGEGQMIGAEKFWNRHTRAFAARNPGDTEVLPYFIMKTADDKILMGWLASQSDLVAEDWMLLEDEA